MQPEALPTIIIKTSRIIPGVIFQIITVYIVMFGEYGSGAEELKVLFKISNVMLGGDLREISLRVLG